MLMVYCSLPKIYEPVFFRHGFSVGDLFFV
jgi:hypothetical protein